MVRPGVTACDSAIALTGKRKQGHGELHIGVSVAHFFVEGGLGDCQRIRQDGVVVLGALQ